MGLEDKIKQHLENDPGNNEDADIPKGYVCIFYYTYYICTELHSCIAEVGSTELNFNPYSCVSFHVAEFSSFPILLLIKKIASSWQEFPRVVPVKT